jgi:antitoxin HicB
MRFVYPAELRRTGPDEIVVSFRDLPECLTSGTDEAEALAEAADALEEAVAGRIDDDEPIPLPSACRPGEYHVAVPPGTAAKAALALAFRDSGLSRSALARQLGVDEKVVRRMLDPRHGTSVSRINDALRLLGREAVLVVQPFAPDAVAQAR